MPTYVNSTNNYATSRIIVSSVLGQGNYQTIQAAITAASAGAVIFIMPGTYTENLTLKAGVNLACWVATGEFGSPNVTIVGKAIDNGANVDASFQNIQFETNSSYILQLTGTTSSIQFNNCAFNCAGNPAISMDGASQNVYWYNCYCNISSGSTSFFSISAGDFWIYNTQVDNSAASTTAPTLSAGLVFMDSCVVSCPLSATSSGVYELNNTIVNTSALNSVALTTSGSSQATCNYCYFSSGTASGVSIGSGTTVTLNYPIFASSNTYYIT